MKAQENPIKQVEIDITQGYTEAVDTKNQVQKPNKSLKFIETIIVLSIIMVGVFVCIFSFGIFQNSICGVGNMEQNCICKQGYYKSGKICVGPFNETIFSKEDIELSLLGQDHNMAPKVLKRHLQQEYKFTENSKKNHSNQETDLTKSHEIKVITEDVDDQKFTLIAYLSHAKFTDLEKDIQQDQDQNVNFEIQRQEEKDTIPTNQQQYGSQQYKEKNISRQTPVARINLDKQGNLLSIQVPINVDQKFEEILLDFLNHYTPNLSKYHYQLYKHIDENGNEIEDSIETTNQEKSSIKLQDFNIVQDDQLTGLQKYLDQNNIITLTKKEFQKRREQKIHPENDVETDKIEELNTDNQKRHLQQENIGGIEFPLVGGTTQVNDENCHQIEIMSGGIIDNGTELAQITVNGKQQSLSTLRGLHIIVFDFNSLKQKYYKNFDTSANPNSATELVNFIKSLNKGDFVAIAAKGEAFLHMNEAAWDVLQNTLGLDERFSLNQSFAGFSQIGRDKMVYDISQQSQISSRFCKHDIQWIYTKPHYQNGEISHYKIFQNSQEIYQTQKNDLLFYCQVIDKKTHQSKIVFENSRTDLESASSHNNAVLGGIFADFIENIAYGDLVIFGILGNIPQFEGDQRLHKLLKKQLGVYPPQKGEHIFGAARKGYSDGTSLTNVIYPTANITHALATSVQILYNTKPNICKTFETRSIDYKQRTQVLVDGLQINDIPDSWEPGIYLRIFDSSTLEFKDFKYFDTSYLDPGFYNYIQNKISVEDIIVLTTYWVYGSTPDLQNLDFFLNQLGLQSTKISTNVFNSIIQYKIGSSLIDMYPTQFDLNSTLTNTSHIGLQEDLGVKATICTNSEPVGYFFITSQGTYGDKNIKITKDGVQLYQSNKQGLHIIVIDQNSYQPKSNKVFDFSNNTQQTTLQLAYYLESIPNGDLIAYGISGINQQFNDQTFQIMENQLGFDRLQYPLNQNDTIAAWTRKGYSKGQATVLMKQSGKGQASIKVSPHIRQIPRQVECKEIELVSGGYSAGNITQIKLDGVKQTIEYGQGINFYVYDQFTLTQKYSRVLDTNSYEYDAWEIVYFINNIVKGDYVLVAVNYDAQANMNLSGQYALKLIGIDHVFLYQESFAAIGIKGDNSAIIDFQSHEIAIVKAKICNGDQNKFVIESQGAMDGSEFNVLKNGVSQLPQKNTNSTKGFNVAVFDQQSLFLTEFQTFQNNANSSSDLTTFINNIPKGDLVAYGIDDSAQDLFTEEVQQSLEDNIGFNSFKHQVKEGDSLSGWGKKGFTKGDGLILQKQENYGATLIQGSPQIYQNQDQGSQCKTIRLTSNAYQKQITLIVDNIEQTNLFKDKSGIHFTVFDKFTLDKKNYTYMDTYSDTTLQESQKLVDFIQNLEEGDYVFYQVHTDASQYMTQDAYNALQLIGMDQQLNFQDSLVGIGQKGTNYGVYEIQEKKVNGIYKEYYFSDITARICKQDIHSDLDLDLFTVISQTYLSTDTVNTPYFKVMLGSTTLYEVQNQTGLAIVVIDQNTRQVKKSQVIDLQNNGQDLDDFIQLIQYGDYVAYGSAFSANSTHNLQYLESLLGYNAEKFPLYHRQGLAGFARKGMTKGQAILKDRLPVTGKAMITVSSKIQSPISEDQTFCNNIEIISEGRYNGNYSYISVNGMQLPINSYGNYEDVGIYLAVFDYRTLELKYKKLFKEGYLNGDYHKLDQIIDSISDKDFIAITTKGDGTINLENSTIDIFNNQLGISYELQSDVYVALAQKGSQKSPVYHNIFQSEDDIAQIKGSFCSNDENLSQLTLKQNPTSGYTLDFSYGQQLNYQSSQPALIFLTIDSTQQSQSISSFQNLEIIQNQLDVISYIQQIENNQIVIYSLVKYSSDVLQEDLLNALETKLGYNRDLQVQNTDSMIAIAKGGLQKGLAEIQVRKFNSQVNTIFSSPNLKIPEFNKQCHHIKIYSSNIINNTNQINIEIDGQNIVIPNQQTQGIHFVVLDRYNLQIKKLENYNPQNATEIYNMISFINSINQGDFVAITVKDDAQGLTQLAYDALQTIGIRDVQIGQQQPFAGLGRKGLYKGIYDLVPQNQTYQAVVNTNICALDEDFIYVESKGKQNDQSINSVLKVEINGVDIYNQNGRGMHFVILDQYTLEIKNSIVFNPHDYLGDNRVLREFLKLIPFGDIVCFGISEEASHNLEVESYQAIKENLGLDDFQLHYYDSLAVITRKGMISGKALVQQKYSQQNSAKVFSTIRIQKQQ